MLTVLFSWGWIVKAGVAFTELEIVEEDGLYLKEKIVFYKNIFLIH